MIVVFFFFVVTLAAIAHKSYQDHFLACPDAGRTGQARGGQRAQRSASTAVTLASDVAL
jgi:hypothetical protein